ncbi:MAG TPA: hypothetical protein VFD00_07730 [Thermoclostridium sp.]|nr:hypothetical protein [Thermoclostridium sp.]
MTKHELLKYAVSKGIIDLSALDYGISRGSVWQIRKGITYARA